MVGKIWKRGKLQRKSQRDSGTTRQNIGKRGGMRKTNSGIAKNYSGKTNSGTNGGGGKRTAERAAELGNLTAEYASELRLLTAANAAKFTPELRESGILGGTAGHT